MEVLVVGAVTCELVSPSNRRLVGNPRIAALPAFPSLPRFAGSSRPIDGVLGVPKQFKEVDELLLS